MGGPTGIPSRSPSTATRGETEARYCGRRRRENHARDTSVTLVTTPGHTPEPCHDLHREGCGQTPGVAYSGARRSTFPAQAEFRYLYPVAGQNAAAAAAAGATVSCRTTPSSITRPEDQNAGRPQARRAAPFELGQEAIARYFAVTANAPKRLNSDSRSVKYRGLTPCCNNGATIALGEQEGAQNAHTFKRRSPPRTILHQYLRGAYTVVRLDGFRNAASVQDTLYSLPHSHSK